MKLIVTTNKGVKVVNAADESVMTIHDSLRFYFGITFDRDRIIVGCVRDGFASLVYMNGGFEAMRSITTPDTADAAQHGIFFDSHSDKMYQCITGLDVVLVDQKRWVPIVETEAQLRERTQSHSRRGIKLHLRGVPLPPERQRFQRPIIAGSGNLHHINSVFATADSVYVSALNPNGMSEVYEFDHNGAEVRKVVSGKLCHTVWHDGGQLGWIESGNGNVMLGGVSVYRTNDASELVRALAWDGTYYYLGVSTNDRIRERRVRGVGRGKIRVLTEQWQPVRDIDLPDGCSQIYEIRAMCADGRTHNGLTPPIE